MPPPKQVLLAKPQVSKKPITVLKPTSTAPRVLANQTLLGQKALGASPQVTILGPSGEPALGAVASDKLPQVIFGPTGDIAFSPKQNEFPNFTRVSDGLKSVADEEATRLSAQLGIKIRADRMLEAPWIGRIYNGKGEYTSQSSSAGWERNESRFWSEFARQFPGDYKLLNSDGTISVEFAKKMGWPTEGPNSVVGDKMEHHHVGNGTLVAPVPTKLHEKESGKIHGKVAVLTETDPARLILGGKGTAKAATVLGKQAKKQQKALKPTIGQVSSNSSNVPTTAPIATTSTASVAPSTATQLSPAAGESIPPQPNLKSGFIPTEPPSKSSSSNKVPAAETLPAQPKAPSSPPSTVATLPTGSEPLSIAKNSVEQTISPSIAGAGKPSPSSIVTSTPASNKAEELPGVVPGAKIVSSASEKLPDKIEQLPSRRIPEQVKGSNRVLTAKTPPPNELASESVLTKGEAISDSTLVRRGIAARPPVNVLPRWRAVGGSGLRAGAALGTSMFAGMVASYIKSKVEQQEIQRDIAKRTPEIEQAIEQLAQEISTLQSISPGATVFANITVVLRRARSFTPDGNVRESIATVQDLSVAVSKEDLQTSEASAELESEAWYIKLFSSRTQMIFSVPLPALNLQPDGLAKQPD